MHIRTSEHVVNVFSDLRDGFVTRLYTVINISKHSGVLLLLLISKCAMAFGNRGNAMIKHAAANVIDEFYSRPV